MDPEYGIEGDLPEPHPPKALLEIDVPPPPSFLVVSFGSVRIGELSPVVDDPDERPVGEEGGLLTSICSSRARASAVAGVRQVARRST